MTKTVLYTYKGVNGSVQTSVLLEGIDSIKQIKLTADNKKYITRDGIHLFKTMIVSEADADLWYDVNAPVGH